MKEGFCPKCKELLEYGIGEVQDSQYSYEVSCPECGWKGLEWYNMVFVEQDEI